MPTMYHGTSTVALPEILKTGLVPRKDRRFDVSWVANMFDYFGSLRRNANDIHDGRVYLRDSWPEEQQPLIYLTKDPNVAHNFAVARAQYDRTAKGEETDIPMLPAITRKESGEAHPEALPVILKVEVPDDAKIWADPSSADTIQAYVCDCGITPERITPILLPKDESYIDRN